MIVEEFCTKRYEGFPDGFYDSLPHTCNVEGCGFPLVMSDALTQLHCSNPRCPAKIAQRLVALCASKGIKGIGESVAMQFVKAHGITSPLLIYAYNPDPDEDGVFCESFSEEHSSKLYLEIQSKKTFTLAEYVRAANLPYIQTSAVALFGNFDDLEEAYAEIEDGGVEYISEKLDISTEGVSVRALRVYESLLRYKSELFACLPFVTIVKTNTADMINLTAVCSDEVGGGFKTKAEFYTTVNNRYRNVHVEFLGAVTKKIDFLIWAGADGSPARYTNKVKKVESYNEKGCNIPIMTAGQFIAMLDTKGDRK